jgi:ribosomal protein S12 methylthiotransferase
LDFLKICEGCFNQCSYCTIPLIKGTLKSKPPSQIVKEACLADKHGVKELNIIGQDISSWGRDLGADFTLPTLLKDILVKTKIAWLRLLYLHPRHISEELLDLIANEDRICKYIDLPIQHVNDRILKLMNRGITKKEIAQIIAKIREKINNCAIRTSVIAGFPTETKEEFKELLQFLKEVKFEKLGAFVYSREEDTPAYKLKPQVLAKTKEQRYRQIMNLQKNISKELNKKFIGQTLEVLVEEEDNGVFLGRSQYDAYEVDGLVFIKKNGLRIGDFYKTKIINSYDYDLVGV